MSGWNAQKYANVPADSNVRDHEPPAAIISESNEPSSAVTVCGASPLFRHVTVEPTGIDSSAGEKAKSAISASTPVVAGFGVGVGVGDGFGFGVEAAAEPAPPLTTTFPVISGWIAHRYANVPADLKVRFQDPPSEIVPLLNAPSLAVTV